MPRAFIVEFVDPEADVDAHTIEYFINDVRDREVARVAAASLVHTAFGVRRVLTIPGDENIRDSVVWWSTADDAREVAAAKAKRWQEIWNEKHEDKSPANYWFAKCDITFSVVSQEVAYTPWRDA